MSTEITTMAPAGAVTIDADGAMAAIHARLSLAARVRAEVLKPEIHYGVIPGTNRPTLLQPGAQVLCMAFSLVPEILKTETRYLEGGHLDVEVTVSVIHAPTGISWACGIGSASTLESKHRWRNAKPTCPNCGVAALMRSKFDDGYYCNAKAGGCGAKHTGSNPAITSQPVGRVENPDPADCYNTVRKMAWKRAYLAAVLTATGTSEHFTQDMEESAPSAETPRHLSPVEHPRKSAATADQGETPDTGTRRLVGLCMKLWNDPSCPHQLYLEEQWQADRGEKLPKFTAMAAGDLEYCLKILREGAPFEVEQ